MLLSVVVAFLILFCGWWVTWLWRWCRHTHVCTHCGLQTRDLRSFEIRFRIELPIRDSIRSDDPIRNFWIVRTVNRPL